MHEIPCNNVAIIPGSGNIDKFKGEHCQRQKLPGKGYVLLLN